MPPFSETPRKIAVISKGGYWPDYSAALVRHLCGSGFSACILEEFRGDEPFDLFVVVGIHAYPQVRKVRHARLVGVQTEQLPTPSTGMVGRLKVNSAVAKSVLPYYDLVIEWHRDAHRHFYRGENVRFFPFGCLRQPLPEIVQQDYDVLFVGKADGFFNRRAKFLEAVSQRFKLHPNPENLWGSAKPKAILNSKICLNLHFDPCRQFESPRIFDYLSLGGFVLTEEIADSFPFENGRDYVSFAGQEDLLEKIQFYLEHDEQRRTIAIQGHKTANQFSFDATMPALVNEISGVIKGRRRPFLRSLNILTGQSPLLYWRAKQVAAQKWRAFKSRG